MNTPASLPGSAQRVADLLASLGHDQPVVVLPSSGKTSAEAAAGLGCTVAQIAKSIVFRRLADYAAVVVIASGAHRVDAQRVAALVGPLGKADADFVEGVELVWEAEGLWEPAQTLALARKLAMQTIVPAFDGTGRPFAGSLERRWLRVDGAGPTDRLRGVLAESLAFAVEGAEDIDAEGPVVLVRGAACLHELAVVRPGIGADGAR